MLNVVYSYINHTQRDKSRATKVKTELKYLPECLRDALKTSRKQSGQIIKNIISLNKKDCFVINNCKQYLFNLQEDKNEKKYEILHFNLSVFIFYFI